MRIRLKLGVALLGALQLSFPAFADAIEGKKGPTEIITNTTSEDWRDVDPAQVMVIDLDRGRVTIELSDIFAPAHVDQMKALTKAGFYNGLSFYRVIDGFVAQAGDVFETRDLPAGTMRGLKAEFEVKLNELDRNGLLNSLGLIEGDGYTEFVSWYKGFPFGSEMTNEANSNWLLHCSGAIAMARDVPKDTGGTEFYITLQPQRYLDRNLTVFGRVIDGMEHLQALKRQQPPESPEESLGEIMKRVWIGDTPPEGESSPNWQVIRTDTQVFADYVEARRNRPEAFFYYRPNHVDICQLPIPVRRTPIESTKNTQNISDSVASLDEDG